VPYALSGRGEIDGQEEWSTERRETPNHGLHSGLAPALARLRQPVKPAVKSKIMMMKIIKMIFILSFVVMFFPASVLAEVSDKMPSITRIWVQGAIVGGIGLVLAYYRMWAGLIFGIVTAFFCIGTYDLISDPYVGPAIIAEQGKPYLFAVYGSIVLMSAPLITGLYIRCRQRRMKPVELET